MENKQLINQAINFIQKNPRKNLSLQNIADNAGFSLTYFDKIFRQHTGYSPVEYSRIYKLTRSAIELRRTEKTIIDIALNFGYSSPESFTRAFKNFYSISPAEYRTKYSDKAITWHDLSGKIAIGNFKCNFPEFKVADIDLALDFCFTHNPLKYAEDIIGMTIAESEILTLGNPEELEHFICISDYNSPEPVVSLFCENETDALVYLKLLSKNQNIRFSIHQSVDCEWKTFDKEAEKLCFNCRYGYDMIYPYEEVSVPQYNGMTVREICAEDMNFVKLFKQNGGCAECHVKAIQGYFDKKGNMGMRPIGLFANNEMIGLAMPILDQIRELRKYDIGAIFTLEKERYTDAIDLLWKYAVYICLKDNAVIGNANAHNDTDTSEKISPLSVEMSERIGLIKAAKNCSYSK